MWPSEARIYDFERIPVGVDICVIGESQMAELAQRWADYLAQPDGTHPPHPNQFIRIRTAAIETLGAHSCEVNICIDQSSRYHGAIRTLPRGAFVACVDYYSYANRAYLIVSQDWFEDIERLRFSLYAMVDVAGMGGYLARAGKVAASDVTALRDGFDLVADRNADHAFLTFADTVIIKANWSAAGAHYADSYRPEKMLELVGEIASVFGSVLGLESYAVLAQGSNQFVDESLVSISAKRNHVFFSSLGAPFAELFDIDDAAREAIRAGTHERSDLYLSHSVFLTLSFREYEVRSRLMEESWPFSSKMVVPDFRRYHVLSRAELMEQLRPV